MVANRFNYDNYYREYWRMNRKRINRLNRAYRKRYNKQYYKDNYDKLRIVSRINMRKLRARRKIEKQVCALLGECLKGCNQFVISYKDNYYDNDHFRL